MTHYQTLFENAKAQPQEQRQLFLGSFTLNRLGCSSIVTALAQTRYAHRRMCGRATTAPRLYFYSKIYRIPHIIALRAWSRLGAPRSYLQIPSCRSLLLVEGRRCA